MAVAVKDMQGYIREGLRNSRNAWNVGFNLASTFQHLAVDEQTSYAYSRKVLADLKGAAPLAEAEKDLYAFFSTTPISATNQRTVTQQIDHQLKDRAQIIHGQIRRKLSRHKGKPIADYAAGDCQVTQLLHNEGHNICGVDIRDYRAPGITVPFHLFNGIRTAFNARAFTAVLATNVLHHAAENEPCIAELSRIADRKLVIIETVPHGETEAEAAEDHFRTWMNDYFYNRLLHDPAINIPVPGTYETANGWEKRFARHGWTCAQSIPLGHDIPVIADLHHLLVFTR